MRGPRAHPPAQVEEVGDDPSFGRPHALGTLGARRQRLIRALQDCATATEHCASLATGLSDMTDTIESCRDAAALCRVTAELLARGSAFDTWLVPASILAAEVCESECGVHMGKFFQEASAACRRVRAIVGGQLPRGPANPN